MLRSSDAPCSTTPLWLMLTISLAYVVTLSGGALKNTILANQNTIIHKRAHQASSGTGPAVLLCDALYGQEMIAENRNKKMFQHLAAATQEAGVSPASVPPPAYLPGQKHPPKGNLSPLLPSWRGPVFFAQPPPGLTLKT